MLYHPTESDIIKTTQNKVDDEKYNEVSRKNIQRLREKKQEPVNKLKIDIAREVDIMLWIINE